MMNIISISQAIREYVEDDYVLNRDKIISELYVFFGDNKSEVVVTKDEGVYVSEDDKRKFIEIFDRLKKIQKMVECYSDENEILSELEIVGMSMRFLQKHAICEINRKSRKGLR